MKAFHLVYYINVGCPSIEYSLDKAEKYLLYGVKALQFDLPSRNPYRETQFIKDKMKYAYKKYGNYDVFLEALTRFRNKHTDFEMQMVSYEDVLLTIGTTKYIEFCKKNNIKTCRISGDGIIETARLDMNAAGIDTLMFIDFDLPQKEIDLAVKTGRGVMLRNIRQGMKSRKGLVSWNDRIKFIKKEGVSAPIYATAGIANGKALIEAKEAGANGAFVGSCLMNLWEDEKKMLELLNDLEKAAVSK
ncbi:tryptophan synthase subunit alpha [Treponema parvum]|uniref:tryptophan synthase n=1 Tax=Treponema parvum TaxID=138851 RepID=A0A975F234_9SPIR|nr:tryptophan synthase subunit alpha [Treponema parvum]QTQ12982.1 tryptophan synthase subunit alpha [Treponema parvum]